MNAPPFPFWQFLAWYIPLSILFSVCVVGVSEWLTRKVLGE